MTGLMDIPTVPSYRHGGKRTYVSNQFWLYATIGITPRLHGTLCM